MPQRVQEDLQIVQEDVQEREQVQEVQEEEGEVQQGLQQGLQLVLLYTSATKTPPSVRGGHPHALDKRVLCQ